MAQQQTTMRKTSSELSEHEAPIVAELVQELNVSGHLMSLPAGLFCILHEPVTAQTGQNGLPAVRISMPPNGASGVEIAGFRPDGWLGAGGEAALVKVTAGPAQILVTIYQAQNGAKARQSDTAPKLQVRQLLAGLPLAPLSAVQPSVAPSPPEKFDVLAHVQGSGDRGAKFGGWLGEPNSGNWIEGFAIAPLEGFEPGDLSYQAVLGRGWLSPWVEAGQYCGSRGMALPLLGFRIRLQGAAAEAFELSASASFVDGTLCGPVESDRTCESEKLAPLEAMTIHLTPRTRKSGRPRR